MPAPLNKGRGKKEEWVVRIVSLTKDDDIHRNGLGDEAKYAPPLPPEWFNLLTSVNFLIRRLFDLRQDRKAVMK